MFWRFVLAAAAACVVASVPAQAQVELRMVSAFDSRLAVSERVVGDLAQRLKEATDGRITLRVAGPDVVPVSDQFEATAKGLYDLLFTTQAHHAGVTSLALGIYATKPDPIGWREHGLFDAVDKDYERFNLKLLAVVFGEKAETGAFQIVLRQPVGPTGDLTGLKIRGSRVYQPLIEGLGGMVVLMRDDEIHGALEAGIIDGAAWPIAGAIDYRWHEVARFMARPTFGHRVYILAAGLDRFRRLPAADRTLLAEIGKRLEVTGMTAMDEQVQSDLVHLKSVGMQETRFDEQKFARALARYYDALWAAAAANAASAEPARALRESAQKAGLAE
jgi:TRAP-type C4-dicarboxylate transport system substrate-binding protein